ncbi:hypothetical protein C9374_009351 [Naegleria lovaniensis]|uniref:Uncharacterized protein n=1 Tax=Naegleria lovaniensis TaxID=51637 RepID=A0AA88KF19_NAELO|nr:uncharacterized protein C9374_009351 [Naegleria lovaniensis]KAG2377440.1 hypothetical protein C9374_009351 [Naegleria lovaniensis]
MINTTNTSVNMIVSSTTSSLFSMCEHYLELALSTALECTCMENLCKPNSQLVLDSIDSIQDPFDSELCEFGFAEPHFEHDLKEELLRMEKVSENRCINKSYVESQHGCCRRPPYLIRNQKCSPQTTPFIVVSKIEKLQNSTSRYANRLHAPQESFLCPVDALR